MKTELKVLHLENRGPFVLYSDACAAIERLESEVEQKEQLRANAVRRCEVLLTELESLSAACERLMAQLASLHYHKDSLAMMEEKILARDRLGRWDGKPSVL